MIRYAAIVLCSAIAVAQAPQGNPFDTANQAYWQARQKGQYGEASAHREEMNSLLQTLAPDEPPFAGRAQSLAQAYDNDGMSATGRAVLEGALAHSEGAAAPAAARITLLMSLASFWERDRNLLKSLAFMERAVTVSEQMPKTEESNQKVEGSSRWYSAARPGVVVSRVGFISSAYGAFSPTVDRASLYSQLADLYQRLGRRDQASAVLAKMKALPAQRNGWSLAQYYQQHGDPEEAAAIYKKQMEELGADPQAMIFSAQSLASIYEQQRRLDDAAEVLQQAIAASEGSAKPELAAQTVQLRQRLATLLYRTGHSEAAEQAFPLPTESGVSAAPMTGYANYLGATQRAAQGEAVLANYLAEHPSLSVGEQANILMSLGNLARMAGDSKRADEYSRQGSQKLLPQDPQPEAAIIGPTLQKAQSEASKGNTAEAVRLATQAVAQSGHAPDRDVLASMMSSLANILSNKAPEQAEELYRIVSQLTESWSAETMLPWLYVAGDYPRFLIAQQRATEALQAIERYRAALKTARGADTGWLEEPLRLTIDLERGRNSPQAAIPAAQSLLALEESLDGPTSDPSYRAAETLADLYRATGDAGRALPLYQRTVAIADTVFLADDARRGRARMNAASLLVTERRLDEAEQLVLEAIGLRKEAPAGRKDGLTQLLDQIHALKNTR